MSLTCTSDCADLDPFAVQLARVTMWMGHKLAVDELGIDETVLPLADLSGIRRGDALRVGWPRADAIIGNPPYHGDRRLRGELGDDCIDWLKREFKVGVKDYCVYWFRRAHEHLDEDRRAGLVGTNSVSQNRARGASLDYIAGNGGVIVNAVSSQDWSGEAAVDVSIVNWIKDPGEAVTHFVLDGREVTGITTSLRPAGDDLATATKLAANRRRSFIGQYVRGVNGFLISPEEADHLLTDARYRTVVRPYLTSEDLVQDPEQRPRRFVIDFGTMSLEEAARFPAALEYVRDRAKPSRDLDPAFADNWWKHWRPRPEMRAAVAGLERFIVGTNTAKRIFFAWCDPWTCPSHAVNVFAFDDDWGIGVLTSRVHTVWAASQSSTLEDRIRYTPTSAFETFAWPQPDGVRRDAVAVAAHTLVSRRSEICVERQVGLTRLYNEIDDGAYKDLRDLHVQLDEAVATAYGWPPSVAHDPQESNRLLLELNRAIAAGEIEYKPFD